ncbi:hypothetical protein JCM15519_20770 [Fundidesulfovibrio butyratiphilus]
MANALHARSADFPCFSQQTVLLFAQAMPVNAVACRVGVADKRIWRVVTHDVIKAMAGLSAAD